MRCVQETINIETVFTKTEMNNEWNIPFLLSSLLGIQFKYSSEFFICWTTWNFSFDIHIYPTPPLGQDMTQGQFLSGVKQVWIQSFPSPRLVASPRLKNLLCPFLLIWFEDGPLGFLMSSPFSNLKLERNFQFGKQEKVRATLFLSFRVFRQLSLSFCPVGWDCRIQFRTLLIHFLYLRG